MEAFRLPLVDAPEGIGDLLFAAWVQFFAVQKLGFRLQFGGGPTDEGGFQYSIGSPDDRVLVLSRTPDGQWTLDSPQGDNRSGIRSIIGDATEKYSVGDLGEGVIHETVLKAQSALTVPPDLHFSRIISDQVRVTGPRRLGPKILLDFTEEESVAPAFLAPAVSIKATIQVAGPIFSRLTERLSMGMMEIVGAICALALGRSVEFPWNIFPLDDNADYSTRFRSQEDIGNLACDRVSLDIFRDFGALGDVDGMMRARSSFLSYHAALQQSSPDVAMMLFVSAMESLIVPRASWRKDKATKRFVESIAVLCPSAIDELIEEASIERAFEYKKRGGPTALRRQLLNQIYALRSDPTHSGVGLSGSGMLGAFTEPGAMRLPFLSKLARAALLSFLEAPRSSLIGHPMFNTDRE
jgi:hypothetical protein